MKIEFRAGDDFTVRGGGTFGWLINWAQKIKSADNKSIYSHAGVITDEWGNTVESLTKIDKNNIRSYIGKQILIVRPNDMTPERFQKGYDMIKDQIGMVYPLWRIPLFLLPEFVLKYLSFKSWLVCSELVAKFLCGAGIRHCQYTGTDVDTLADEFEHYKDYTILFQGVLKEENL